MPDTNTADNQVNTLSDRDFAAKLALAVTELINNVVRPRIDHIDAQVHEIDQKVSEIHAFITEHKPALSKAMALLDPGASMRGLLTGKRHRKDSDAVP